MNNRKFYWVMIGMVVLLVVGIFGVAILGNRLLKDESKKLVDLKLQGYLLDEQQQALIRANNDIETYSELEEIAKTVVPQDKDQAKAVTEITKIASDNGIKLASITFPASSLGEKPSKPAATPDDSDKNNDTATPAPSKPSITQVEPVNGISGVYTMQITIQQDRSSPITYDSFIRFLSQLEKNRRTAHVSTVNIEPQANNRNMLIFTITVNVYIKP